MTGEVAETDEPELDPEVELDSLVALLRKERLARGWSQWEVARRLGHASQSAVQRWEAGGMDPQLASLRAWAAVFDIEIVARGFKKAVGRRRTNFNND